MPVDSQVGANSLPASTYFDELELGTKTVLYKVRPAPISNAEPSNSDRAIPRGLHAVHEISKWIKT